MEDEEEVPGMLPPASVQSNEQASATAAAVRQPASLESRSKRKKMPSSIGRGRGSTAAKSIAPSASISADTDTHIEPLVEDEDGGENFDINAAAISVSVTSDDDDDDESQEEEDGDDASVPSNPSKGTRGQKKLKVGAGIHLSPSKSKVKRGKRAGCWKYFKEINVQSAKEFGVMVTKAKCRFCHKSYVYHSRGSTTQLNRHLGSCTQFQNKLAKAKRQMAQGRRRLAAPSRS